MVLFQQEYWEHTEAIISVLKRDLLALLAHHASCSIGCGPIPRDIYEKYNNGSFF